MLPDRSRAKFFYMEAPRMALYRMLVVAPAAYLLALGVVGRVSRSSYEFPEYSYRDRKRLEAYIEVAEASRFATNSRQYSVRDLETASAMWIRGFESGKLQPVPAAFYGDLSTEGVKDQVSEVVLRLVERLFIQANQGSHPATSVHLALLAAETPQSLREFDLLSLTRFAQTVHRTIEMVNQKWSKLSPGERKAVQIRLAKLRYSDAAMKQQLDRNRELLFEERRRQGLEEIDLIQTSRFVTVAVPAGVTSTEPVSPRLATTDVLLRDLMSDADAAVSSMRILNFRIDKLLGKS